MPRSPSYPYPWPVRPAHRDEYGLPALIYSYPRVTHDLDDHAVRAKERGLQEPAETAGLCYATTFHDNQPGYHGGFDELTRELQQAHAHHVIVPCLGHLSEHPLPRTLMLHRLARDTNARVWVWVVTRS
ncbi:MAG: recombinase family protein [Pseudonocardia sp.]